MTPHPMTCTMPGCKRPARLGGVCDVHDKEQVDAALDKLAKFNAAAHRRSWYNFLERLVPCRDVVMLAGGALIVTGVALVYKPAALLVAGVGLIWLAKLMVPR